MCCRIPTHGALVNVRYASFDAALRDARALVPFGAASIETVDSKVLALAQEDMIWEDVRGFFPDDDGEPAAGVNLIEFVGDTEAEVEEPLRRLTEALDAEGRTSRPPRLHGRARRDGRRAHLGDAQEIRRPARQHEGRQAADPLRRGHGGPAGEPRRLHRRVPCRARSRGLDYGMFGHVDAGVLHVRPAIDMKDPAQETLIREVTEEVVGAHAEIWRAALGRARQGRALGILAPLLRPALPGAAGD